MRNMLKKTRNGLVRLLEVILIVSMIVLALDVLWGVFSRYVLGAQSRWTEELAIYLLIWVSLLGASVTYGEKGHLGVDYFVGKMDVAAQRVAAIAIEILVILFSAFALVGGGWVLVTRTLADGQVSPALNWPMGYVYLAAPITGCFFILFALESLVELLGGESPVVEASKKTEF